MHPRLICTKYHRKRSGRSKVMSRLVKCKFGRGSPNSRHINKSEAKLKQLSWWTYSLYMIHYLRTFPDRAIPGQPEPSQILHIISILSVATIKFWHGLPMADSPQNSKWKQQMAKESQYDFRGHHIQHTKIHNVYTCSARLSLVFQIYPKQLLDNPYLCKQWSAT